MKENEIREMIDDRSDAKSIDYFIREILTPNGWTNIVNNNNKNKFAVIDVEADKNGIHYNFELKRRRCNSDYYPDSVLSANKFNAMREKEGRSYYVAFYYDKIAFIDVKDDTQITRYEYNTHRKTTDFDRDEMITELNPYFKITKTIKYQ